MATQSAAGLVALVLAALTLSGRVQLWMVFALALVLGFVNVLDNPTRQSFVTEMVGSEQLANAVALNSAVFTSARVVGPAVAGVLISLVGTGWCFLYNGLSYFPVVGALALMSVAELHRARPLARGKGQIVEGLRYAWFRPELRLPLLLMLVVGTLAFNFSVVLPLMTRYAFHAGAGTYGALMSTMGVGSLAGALLAAGRGGPTHRRLVLASIAFGALMLAAAVMPNLALELLVLIPMGTAMVTCQATANSLLQLNSDPLLRGRVMALYVTVFVGSTPIGGPLVGWVCQTFGPRAGFLLGGGATLVAALLALWGLQRIAGARGAGPAATESSLATG
jgi:MFS family permease